MSDHVEDYTVPLDVHSLEEMDYHVRVAVECQTEIDRLNVMYRTEIDRLTNRWSEQVRILQGRRDWHLAPVESYHRAHPKKRTIPFVYGTSKLRVPTNPNEGVVKITDKDAVTDWARQHHPEVLGKPSILEIRRVVEVVEFDDGLGVVDPDTGAVVEGLDVFLPEPTWNLDIADGDGL